MSQHAVAASMAGSEEMHAEHDDPVASRIGMWLFLFTELLLFGAVFIAYAVYLSLYRWEFQEVSRHLDKLAGAGNTIILLTSSLTMALSIAALSRDRKGLSLGLMALTLALAGGFMVVKAFEWSHKFHADIYPKSATVLEMAHGKQVFYGLYFTMTGLHALHVIIGAVAIIIAMILVRADKVSQDRITLLENVGLYWHLVDLIWILLFPLFYLIG